MSERQEAVIVAWAKHRAGVEQLGEDWPLYMGKALNLDRRAQGFLETFGKREFYGFVGFIDLCGFSTHTSSLSPKEVHDFAMRFLEPVITDITKQDAFVDKTIGDEVMFVLPDFEYEGGAPAIYRMERLMGSLGRTAQVLGADYQMKLGLAYGEMYLGCAQAEQFSEWTAFGQPVHLAKRVQDSATKETASPLFGRFAVLVGDAQAQEMYTVFVNNVRVLLEEYVVVELGEVSERGVSPARCVEFLVIGSDEPG